VERNVPVTGCISGRAIGSEEPGLAETGRDSGIFDAPVLMDRCLSCGESVLKASEGSLESCMADNRLVHGRDSDAHRRQGRRVKRRRVTRTLVNKGRRGPNWKIAADGARNERTTDRPTCSSPIKKPWSSSILGNLGSLTCSQTSLQSDQPVSRTSDTPRVASKVR
jgi:hypothetical protein